MSRLDSQVAAVQRKLTLAIFIDWLAVAGFVLAVLSLLMIIVQRALQLGLPARSLWIGIGAGIVVALGLTLWRRPSREAAAVVIDERLALKEKFSTALAVRRVSDPFAQAVVLDAERTADQVRVSSQFPLSFPKAGYGAIFFAVLALLAFMFVPRMDLLGREQKEQARREQERQIAEAKQSIRETLVKIEALPKAVADNEQIRLAKADLEEMLSRPMPDIPKAARVRMDALSKMDEALKQQVQQNQQFAQMQKNLSMFQNMVPPEDAKGPVAEAHRKIVEGDFKEALEKLQQAVEKLEKMSPKEQEEAAKQMQNMAQQLAAMAQDPRAMKKMENAMQQLGADKQQVQQAQELMRQAANGDQQAQQQLQQLQQQLMQGLNPQQQQMMQQMMQQAQQAANAQGQAQQMAQAAQQMAQAMQQMAQQGGQAGGQAGQMAAGAQQLQEMLQQMEAIAQDAEAVRAAQQAMQDAMCQAGGQCEGDGDKPGPGGQGPWRAGEADKVGNGMGGPGIGQGGEAQRAAAPFGTKSEISKSHYDEKGKHLASTFVKDRSVRGEARLELQKVIEASQAAEGDDVDDFRADRRTMEVQRRYFQVMEQRLEEGR